MLDDIKNPILNEAQFVTRNTREDIPNLLYGCSPYARDKPKIGRNTKCECGSGRKFKKCCEAKK